MYCSLVRPILGYCTVVWSGTSRKNIKNIETIQRSITRYVFNYAEVDFKDRLLMTNILPLTMRREYTDYVIIIINNNNKVFIWRGYRYIQERTKSIKNKNIHTCMYQPTEHSSSAVGPSYINIKKHTSIYTSI